MTKQLRRALILVPIGLSVPVAAALGTKVHVGPVKGVIYVGTVRNELIALKVAKSGKTARVSLPIAPAFCQGGSGAEQQQSKSSTIAKSGSFTTKISYLVRPTNRRFATVTVSGYFYGSVFRGTVKSSFTPASSCDGQESFQAKVRG